MAVPQSNTQFASLYVGDLSPEVNEQVLFDIFSGVGPVASIRVCRDSVTRRSLGYAYVNYQNVTDAERALDTLNYTTIKDRCCRIMWSHRDPALRKTGSGNVFVKNLDKNIDNKALYDTFSLFGNILSCKVASDPVTGKSFGYGFVHYETEEAAKQAIDRVNNMQIGTKTVYVSEFQKKEARPQTEKKFTNVYIKGIPDSMDDDSLKAKLEAAGKITSFVVQKDPKDRRFAFCNFDSFDAAAAAVESLHEKDFRNEEEKKEAEAAPAEGEEKKEEENPLMYCQRAMTKSERIQELKQQFPAKGPATHQGVNLYIKNLADNIDDEKLRELFTPFGNIASVKVMRDEKNVSRGFGFVSFQQPEEATKAVTEMHLKLVNSKPLYVGLAEKREQRQARLIERYRARPGMPGPTGPMGYGQQAPGPMYFSSNMMGARPMMQQPGGNPMMNGQYGARPGGPQGMRPAGMPYMQMMGMQRGPMMNVAGARPKMMRNPMNAAYKFTPQARNQQAPNMDSGYGGPDMQSKPPQATTFDPTAPLTAAALAAAPPGMQKQMLGEKLFPLISRYQPELAGKITGMMLEMDNSELLILLESETQLKNKVDEALRVIESATK